MPFQNKGFWMENVNENSSRIETKRSHQWFLDGSDAESFPNKKQAVEIPNLNSFSGLLNSDMCSWGNPSGFAAQFNERLFDPEAARHVNFDDRNVPSSGIGSSMYTVRKDVDAPFGNDPLFGLSMSHAMEDPRLGLNYGGIRKVKVSQVKDSENLISVSMGDGYTRGDNNNSNIMTTAQAYSKGDENIISMGLSYDRGDDNILSIGDSFSREGGNLMTMGQSYDKGDNNEISMNHAYKENDSAISIGGSVSKDENNGSTIGQTFSKGEGNMMSIGHLFEENNNGVSTDQTFDKGDSNITLTGQAFTQGKSNTVLRGHCYNEVGGSTNHLSLGHSFSKGESNIISFGGCNDDDDDISPSGRVICSYELLMGHQRPETEKGSVDTNAGVGVNDVQATVSVTKNREEQKATKKAPQNNFPSNVRSLLSTGMLDEVPVKYIAWSREKELRGVIKGSGYLCGCQSCNFSKAINAYEFERHAGCKTKHPNNHIYFENGKTIYGIVQELRSTPQHLLFDVIQTITGSPINQKSFRLWKESFLAATRELQRIYGKEEVKQLS